MNPHKHMSHGLVKPVSVHTNHGVTQLNALELQITFTFITNYSRD